MLSYNFAITYWCKSWEQE